MPVYDYSYQTYDGQRQSALWRWLAIPKFTYLECFEKRAFLQFFMIAWLQLGLRLAYMYLLVNVDFLRAMGVPLNILVPVNAFFFKNMIDIQMTFCFIFAMLIGAGLIARDLQHSAFVLYASKPIGRWEYFAGKFSVLFFLFMALTWAQTALLLVVQPLISPAGSDWWLHFWSQYAWIFPATAAYAVVIAVTLSLMILAASSLTRNARYAGMIFASTLIGAHVTAQILGHSLNMKLAGPALAADRDPDRGRLDLSIGSTLGAPSSRVGLGGDPVQLGRLRGDFEAAAGSSRAIRTVG